MMNSLPVKRDFSGDERIRSSKEATGPRGLEDAKLGIEGHASSSLTKISVRQAGDPLADGIQHRTSKPDPARKAAELLDPPLSTTSMSESGRTNDRKESVIEEDPDLDEIDFEKAEERFERELQALESKKPATPRHHPILLLLLEELDALARAAEDKANGLAADTEPDDRDNTNRALLEIASPKSEEANDTQIDAHDYSIFSSTKFVRPNTPPIESLPFLVSGPSTPFSELEDLQEQLEIYGETKIQVIERIANQHVSIAAEHEELRDEYARLYKLWKLRTEELDHQRGVDQDTTPAPTSPTPAVSLVVTPAPILEGRRPGKYQSALDLQRVIDETAQAAQEDKDRREREAKTVVDTMKEAVIPNMLNRYELERAMFKDTNHLVDSQLVLDVFAFDPQEDDFNQEEQDLFVAVYVDYPKKWSKIAEAIPGRDYQDCIRHYYRTKFTFNYKKAQKLRGTRKGKKVAKGAARPKSNALMSDLGGRADLYESNEFDTPNVAVTETGRPRRAAAPANFRDGAGDADPITPVPTPGRRNAAAARIEISGDPKSTLERPSNKRTKTNLLKEKGPKKGKAPLLAAAPGPSPQKVEKEAHRGKSKEPKVEDEPRMKDMEEAALLPGLHASQIAPMAAPQIGYNENWLGGSRTTINGPVVAPKQQPNMQEQLPQPKGTPQTSSYWSVPEQQDFFKLICHFGSDWQAIANYMKSKTQIMVNLLISLLVQNH